MNDTARLIIGYVAFLTLIITFVAYRESRWRRAMRAVPLPRGLRAYARPSWLASVEYLAGQKAGERAAYAMDIEAIDREIGVLRWRFVTNSGSAFELGYWASLERYWDTVRPGVCHAPLHSIYP